LSPSEKEGVINKVAQDEPNHAVLEAAKDGLSLLEGMEAEKQTALKNESQAFRLEFVFFFF